MIQTTSQKKKKGEEVSNSNGIGSYIPHDIHFSILSKLPVKSIKRFSCVCKSWSNKLKLNFPHPFNTPELDTIDILGSVNGILCVIGYIRNIGTSTILLNPATEEVKVLPVSRGELLSEITTELVFHGFGYDNVRDDYKIIQYVDVVEGKDPFWEIYSLKTDSWRKIRIDMPVRCGVYANRDVYLNGVCHWLGQVEGNDEKFNMVMVSFHLGNEVCFVTPLPFLEDMEYGFEDVKLQVFNGSVAVIFNHIETKSFHISILGEKIGVKESWVRLFDIGPFSCIMDPIIVWKKGNILVRKEDDQLACFDLTTGMIEEIGVKAEQFCQVVVYKKSELPFGVIDLCCPCGKAVRHGHPNNCLYSRLIAFIAFL
ncbi:F-box protein interaction domain protein [Medicago truncatula]|uniref:F-box protein interaction domain protein n=1 Tax=Medicago truncatula TaxID=3880 RepID=A0A072UE29_MEDTR|nr:F-box protein interaction domain protein [Medicago truncatula]